MADGNYNLKIKGKRDFGSVTHLPATYGDWSEAEPDGEIMICDRGETYVVSFARKRGTGAASAADGAILAPMPG